MKPIIIAAGGLVTNEKNELLMIFRRGKWDLPKGKLDEGESIEACALREVREETGLQQLDLLNEVGITYHEYFDKFTNADVIKRTHWYAMKTVTDQNLTPQTEEDIEQIVWADRKQIADHLTNSYKNIVEIIDKYLNSSSR
ncbi:NUDIX domain-containing protein [Danxiaibacter flavus]|uniref:NUDIX domain-containing protein n=1 Tax=Danxiaibacter flavus TaxID=3049108 RepID=A0ABV3ZLP4_9BACT|nr:NUDIX domain-containing protein [Chitinophagaceae bacterium DXS]